MDIDALKFQLQQQANPEKKQSMEAYLRHQFAFYGVQATPRRIISKPFFQAYSTKDSIPWHVVESLWQEEERELQYVALDLLRRLHKQLTYADIPRLRQLAETKSWWDTIDVLDRLIGNIGLIDDRVSSLMLQWAEDENFWIRRIAIDHQIGRKNQTDAGLLSRIIQLNFGSDEFFINKAIGWSLREYAKVNPEWVQMFVQKYKQYLAPLSIREAMKYFK